jgi:hypothetical protein
VGFPLDRARTGVLALTILSLAWGVAGFEPATAMAGPSNPPLYALAFVSTAATGVDLNAAREATGTSYRDPGCGSACLPPQDPVVWRGASRIILPGLPGRPNVRIRDMNNNGWVVGSASPGPEGFDDRAVAWKPNGSTYVAIDLGVLPGTTMSYAIGIDDLNRVVGYATTQTFPPNTRSFLWTEGGGLVDLTAMGFPQIPQGISPGGTVATADFWYRLVDPSSVTPLAPPPSGFGIQSSRVAINDDGDQARFLVRVSDQRLKYLFRYHHEGVWQQISDIGTGNLATYGVGSINESKDISATVSSTGVIAFGPTGLAQPLEQFVSPAYGNPDVTFGGPMNASGEVLAQVMVGRSPRLVRLVPVQGCDASCIRVARIQMTGRFVDDPGDPGQCTPEASNEVTAALLVTDESGNRLRGVRVVGHFLDDYWLDELAVGTTNQRGLVRFVHRGPACVGAVAFLATQAVKTGRTFDRTSGELTDYVIPLP